MTDSVLERARARRLASGIAPVAAAQPTVFDDDLVPDPGPSGFTKSPEDQDIDTLLDGVDILQAYRLWCGKMEPKVGSKRESVMVSCPIPGHADAHPSAWVNLDKGTWFCGACNEGGDKFDVAAYGHGYAVPGYKRDGSFPALRRDMAGDMGYTVTRTATREVVSKSDAPGDEETQPDPPVALKLVPVLGPNPVQIDWRKIVGSDTFLHRWMAVCAEDDLPEEFYFWLGLMAVGFGAGDDVVLRDNPPVKANLFTTLYGPTGIGKSRAMRALEELLHLALPYDDGDPHSKGISIIASPGSGETLVDAFSKPIMDPAFPKVISSYGQVRGLLRIDELSDLMGRASRHGSVMKPILMRLYDGYGNIDTRSRGTGYVKAERPFCSAVTSSQPRAIRELLAQTDADSGFVNRWVFAVGEPKKLIAIDREPLHIGSCVSLLQGLRAWASAGREIQLDEDAKGLWADFFSSVIEPIKIKGDDSLLSRCDLTLKKIMLLFAINEKSNLVTADIVERVLELWPYFVYSYGILGGEIGVGEFEDCRLAVLEFVRGWEDIHGIGCSSRDLSRRMPKRFPRKLVLETIRNLTDMGELLVETTVKASKGRPAGDRYRVAV